LIGEISVTLIDQLSKRVNRLLSNVTRLDCRAHGKNERKGWPKPDALCGSGGVWQFCRPFLPPRQTFESDVLAPVSSPFCHSPPPESHEIANELAHRLYLLAQQQRIKAVAVAVIYGLASGPLLKLAGIPEAGWINHIFVGKPASIVGRR